MVVLLRMIYRLMKHMVRENELNAQLVFQRMDVIKSQLGKGVSATIAMKEVFHEKRRILNLIQGGDVSKFMEMLEIERDPRHVDFLAAICACGDDPIPKNQSLVCEKLFREFFYLLPKYRIRKGPAGLEVEFTLPASAQSPDNGRWLNMSSFLAGAVSPGTVSDYASSIMICQYFTLNEDEKMFRYLMRCCSLLSNLVVGRNHVALTLALDNAGFPLGFDDLFAVMTSPRIPAMARARFSQLMLRFHVDRDPQSSKPQISYTRIWTESLEEAGELIRQSAILNDRKEAHYSEETLHKFRKLADYLLHSLCSWEGKQPSGGGGEWSLSMASYGELELILSWIELCDWLVDFGFIVEDRDEMNANFKGIMKLYEGLFRMIGIKSVHTKSAENREELLRMTIRSKSFQLLSRLCNLRANYRITCALRCWEDIFQQMSAKKVIFDRNPLLGSSSRLFHSSNSSRTFSLRMNLLETLREKFRPYEEEIDILMKTVFKKNIVSPETIASDVYQKDHFDEDVTIDAVLSVMRVGDVEVVEQAVSFLISHLFQRSKFIEDLKLLQVLVYPEAVTVYNEIKYIIERLTDLKKALNSDDEGAYQEAEKLLKHVTYSITLSSEIPKEIVAKNQRIMLNWELDEPVVDLLRLTIHDNAKSGDEEVKMRRRKRLFQLCYNFLRALASHHPAAQQKLFPLLAVFLDHVGVANLNVADTLREIVRNNARLCTQVPETFFRHFLTSIKRHGRNARWLRFFDVFLVIDKVPLKRNQDLILRLLMEDKDAVLDLTCDYRESKVLPLSDERYGKDRLTLMLEGEHKRELGSLIKYHISSLEILSSCATGKNVGNKGKIQQEVSFDNVLANLLDLDKDSDGVRRVVDMEVLHTVKSAWLTFLTEIYLTSFDILAIKQMQGSRRVWPAKYYKSIIAVSDSSYSTIPDESEKCLMENFLSSIEFVSELVSNIIKAKDSENNGQTTVHDGTINAHLSYLVKVVSALKEMYRGTEICPNDVLKHAHCKDLNEDLRSKLTELNRKLIRINRLEESRQVIELLTLMSDRGVHGEEFDLPPDEEEEETGPRNRKEQFLEGWTNFYEILADKCGFMDSRTEILEADALKDFARTLVHGVVRDRGDFSVIQQFCRVLVSSKCELSVQLRGLKVLRAIVYMNPANKTVAQQEQSFKPVMRNEDPSDQELADPSYVSLQANLAKFGGVNIIINVLAFSNDSDILHACLCFANALLHGGNSDVQKQFTRFFTSSSSQHLFVQIYKVFQDAVEGLKEVRKRAKQENAERILSRKSMRGKSKSAVSQAFGESQMLITEVSGLCPRVCSSES
eukprot:748658-Hanusia_phi.AAC.3